jgi:hypothetical protein
LGVEDVVHRDNVVVLAHRSRTNTTKLLHVSSNSKKETKVHAEGTDVSSGLARDPEDTEVTVVVKLDELAVVDGTDAELTLDGGDERGTLEEGTGEGFDGAGELLLRLEGTVKTEDADVLLTCGREKG